MNRILDFLTGTDAGALRPALERVPLELNAVLYEDGVTMTHVYFPVSGMISLVTRIGCASVDSATVGSEGMLGLPLFLVEALLRVNASSESAAQPGVCRPLRLFDLVERSPAFSASLKLYTAARLWVT